MSKVNYTEGRSGFLVPATELTSMSESFAGGFCLIKAKGATSHFDSCVDAEVEGGKALEVDMPVWLDAWSESGSNPLEEGDVVVPFDMHTSCWTTDCANSVSEGTVEVTSQCDWLAGRKDIRRDGNITESGTISGYYMTDSEMQRAIEALFSATIEHSGKGEQAKITYVPRTEDNQMWHFLVVRETSTVGEVERTIIRKMAISGFTADVPSNGYVPFNFSYTSMARYNYAREVSA